MKLTEIIKKNRELGAQLNVDIYEIAIISNITITFLKEVLELNLREKGIYAKVTVGNYDAIIQDSLRFSKFKAVLVFWEASNFIEGFQNKCYSMTTDEIDALADRVEGEIELMLNNLKHTPLVLVNHFNSAIFCMDALKEGPLSILCRRLNVRLAHKVAPNQIIVDLEKVLVKVGHFAAVDLRQFQLSKALYSIGFFKTYAEAVMPAFMGANGRAKKILVLDCDNTLWGGILGEDGYDGIELSDLTIKGQAFYQVQTILKGLRRDGVLLALCSKNNQAEVEHVLNNHPNMILKNNDFVAKKINWKDKATNLRELASELNISLDSFVFVDDSSFEVGLIKKELPQIMCIQVPQNLSEYPSAVRHIRQEFFNLSKTAEDDFKTEMYKQEHMRKEHSNQFNSIDEYLTSLELKLKITWQSDIPIPRAAQLTQKTNQFNLTTKRYTEADIQRIISDTLYRIATFSVEDNYGDYGVTGVAIIQFRKELPGTCVIDSFLMSCRIIGRNIEYFFFNELVRILKGIGIEKIIALYKETAKNAQVSRFYDDLGFNLTSEIEGCRNYEISINDYKPKVIKYIEYVREVSDE
jgi:FkbH-like protein